MATTKAATFAHFTQLPELLTAQHGVTISHETLLALARRPTNYGERKHNGAPRNVSHLAA